MKKQLTREEAHALVEAKLKSSSAGLPDNDTLVICDEATIEREFGWVFFYDSKRHRDTGDFKFAVAGNAPYIVNRFNGSVVSTGTAHDAEHYIAEYERTLRDHST
jgi:hypothetical protein